MIQKQEQKELSLTTRFYLFLRDRDARIIEMFFLGLNAYILAFVVLPPYQHAGFSLIVRMLFQVFVTIMNLAALILQIKLIRIISAVSNTIIMALISTALILNYDVHSGTYVLITLLAAFVCWKINVK